MRTQQSRSLRDVHVSVWHRPADVQDVRTLRHEFSRVLGARPGGLLLVVERDVPLSTKEAREVALDMVRALAREIGAIALVIEGEGFGPAAVRAMFTGIGLVARPKFRWKMFSDAEDAAAWLLRNLPEAERPELMTLVGAVDGLRTAPQ